MARRPGFCPRGAQRHRLRAHLCTASGGGMKQLPLPMRLRDDAVFDSFVPGFNVEVLAALRAADRTPLWLFGSKDSGKTHLLQAVCAAGGAGAAYIPLSCSFQLPPQA